MPDSYLAFASISLALALSPGPSWAYVLGAAAGASEPRLKASAAICGNAIGIVGHVIIAVVGLTLLAKQLPSILELIRWAGAAYLIYLGLRTLCTTHRAGREDENERETWAGVLCGGVLVNLLNPKVSLLMLALLPQFVDFDSAVVAWQIATLGTLHVLLATCVLSLLAGGTIYMTRRSQKGELVSVRGNALSIASAIVVILFGMRLIVAPY